MAKNMENTAYRKLDVDAIDPEQYNENEENCDANAIGPDEQLIQDLLATRKLEEALHQCLMDPPYKTKDKQLKERSARVVSRVLQSFKSSEIETAIKTLSIDEGDILMKYIYKCMEIASEVGTFTSLLTWHGHAFNSFGLGSITRVFSGNHRL